MSTDIDIKSQIFHAIKSLFEDKSLGVADDTPLIGDRSLLDSMNLVELCLSLEDMASDLEFEFDWTSAAAMSKSRSMFRTAGTLAAEFIAQREAQK